MNLSASLLQENNAIAALSHQAGAEVTSAIKSASKDHNIDFSYLLKKAELESSFRSDVGAKTSSAKGLFQFTNSTWLEMIDKYGDKYSININQSESALLALRNDPELSANMAAEYANQNKSALERNWGGEVGPTELYLAHFLGPNGAAKFLNARDMDPDQSAARLHNSAAKANPTIFYDGEQNTPRSLEEVYTHFAKKFNALENKQPLPNTEENILTTAQNTLTDESFRLYQQAAKPFFQTTQTSLNDLFRDSGAEALMGAQKLWQMTSIDFVNLLKG